MKISEQKFDCLKIEEIEALDPVTAYFHDTEPGAGHMTVTCYGTAWTAYWGAMGKERTVRQFVSEAGYDYLYGCLMRSDSSHGKQTKAQKDYLMRVCKALKAALEVKV